MTVTKPIRWIKQRGQGFSSKINCRINPKIKIQQILSSPNVLVWEITLCGTLPPYMIMPCRYLVRLAIKALAKRLHFFALMTSSRFVLVYVLGLVCAQHTSFKARVHLTVCRAAIRRAEWCAADTDGSVLFWPAWWRDAHDQRITA